ncbi:MULTISPECIES: hypothetical protein [Providencia]|uniref:hypothetical protein n=1 Tax=Providencia TaxID=586 RepID=UPI00065E0CEA|nr:MULTISPECIES: hypothetical protein [Providencia]
MHDNNSIDKKNSSIIHQNWEFIPASDGVNDGSDDYKKGLCDGITIGVSVGYNVALKRVQELIPEHLEQTIMELPDIKKALSEGLRYGSSSCGRALVKHYRYKKI